jgi:hypothetical protein
MLLTLLRSRNTFAWNLIESTFVRLGLQPSGGPSLALAQTGVPPRPTQTLDEILFGDFGLSATTGVLYSSGNYGAPEDTKIPRRAL